MNSHATPYDVIVIGLGAMGSAATWQLAKRGARVLGIDRFSPPHGFGSSHGDTRITRLAIGEGDHLTPLAIRSHEIWREIERALDVELLTQNGGLIVSAPGPKSFTHVEGFFANTIAAAKHHGIAHELLDAQEIRNRFPPFRVRDGEFGYFESSAGFVRPETAIASQLELAKRAGADFRTQERVVRFEEAAGRVEIETEAARYRADRIVLTAGAWLPSLLEPTLASLFRIYRQVLFWFALDAPVSRFEPARFPVFIRELTGEAQGIYGFPALDGKAGGLKIATETYATATSPDLVERVVSEEEIAAMHGRFVAPYLEGVGRGCVKTAVCLYTVTPDFGFVIDWLPGSERVLIASPCSGHGFKHSAAIGEMLADYATAAPIRFQSAPFGFARFAR